MIATNFTPSSISNFPKDGGLIFTAFFQALYNQQLDANDGTMINTFFQIFHIIFSHLYIMQ